jgi:hypothetical protein
LALAPFPDTLGELREVLARERRRKERRVGAPERRLFRVDRRRQDRRCAHQQVVPVDEEMILAVEEIQTIAEALGDAPDEDREVTEVWRENADR